MRNIILFLLSLCNIASAGTIDIHVDDAKYVEYGSKHKCVVKIEGTFPKDDKEVYFYASAVVFKPRWILTAAHVINNANQCRIVCDNKEKVNIKYVARHADYQENEFGKYDIAIGYLEKDVLLDFYPELYDKNDEVGKVCSMSGYGMTGAFQNSDRKIDYLKRAGSNTIDSIDKHMLICSLNKGSRTSLEFLICHGDSGGGLFIDQKLAGIHSCLMSEDKKLDANIEDFSGHTRVSIFKKWIEESMKAVEEHRDNKK